MKDDGDRTHFQQHMKLTSPRQITLIEVWN